MVVKFSHSFFTIWYFFVVSRRRKSFCIVDSSAKITSHISSFTEDLFLQGLDDVLFYFVGKFSALQTRKIIFSANLPQMTSNPSNNINFTISQKCIGQANKETKVTTENCLIKLFKAPFKKRDQKSAQKQGGSNFEKKVSNLGLLTIKVSSK